MSVSVERRSGMKLLTDAELKAKIDVAESKLITNTLTDDWTSKDSAVQPCSADLHIGYIQVPAEADDQPVKMIEKTGEELVLNTGGTAVVTTVEDLNMPDTIAGIGFPPSHVSIKGLLMTNPGHIDPGYQGPMHFTVINMGRQPFTLRVGDLICTVLFFELDEAVHADWKQRVTPQKSGEGKKGLPAAAVNRLSVDFLSVEKRAKKIARKAIRRAAVYSALLVLAGTVLSQVLPYWLGGLEEAKRNNAVMAKQMEDLEKRVTSLEGKGSAIVPAQPKVKRPSGTQDLQP